MFRQFLTLSAGEGVARGLHAVAFLVLARGVGPRGLGEFGVAQAVASYGLMAVQRGLDVPAMLRAAREPNTAAALRTAVVKLRLPVFVVLLAGAAAWGNGLVLAMAGMWLAGVLQVRWLLLARGQSAAVASGAILASGVFLAASAAGLPLIWVAASLSAGELAAAAWWWGSARLGRQASDGVELALQREAWPFLGSLLLGNLLNNLDIFVLGAMSGAVETGMYVAAYRLITVFSPVLGALQNSALPAFGKLSPDAAAAGKLAMRVWARGFLASVGIALLLAMTPALLLPLLYGESYGGAARLVPVFAFVLPVQVTRLVYRQALFAFRRERTDLWNLAAATAVNLVLDLALVREHGAMGCAVSTLCAESCYAALTWRAWRRVACG